MYNKKTSQSHLEKWYPNDEPSSSMDLQLILPPWTSQVWMTTRTRAWMATFFPNFRSSVAPRLHPPISNANAHQSDRSHVEDARGVNNVDDKLDSPSPTTIQYMDFSSLGLQKQTKRSPMPLLLRGEYIPYDREIANQCQRLCNR